MSRAEIVVSYIRSLTDWQLRTADQPYGHMGATLSDAVLQSGIDYDTVVLPRINRLLEQYPEATTTTVFSKVLEQEGAPSVLRWDGQKKIKTLKSLISLLMDEGVETEDQLRVWLESPQNRGRLQGIDGIGDKTTDYLQILAGSQAIAIDRHLQGFLANAGVPCPTYDEARQALEETATLIGVAPSDLDYSIWQYMSTQSQRPPSRCARRKSSGTAFM
jgi:hypothetical protein